MLTQQRLKEVLDYDPNTGEFRWRIRMGQRGKVGSIAGAFKGPINRPEWRYWSIIIDGKSYLAHRLAWLFMHGTWPKDQIDHLNGIRTDNRICNLREASNEQNLQNVSRYRKNTSGTTGVAWHKDTQKWCAYINSNGKRLNLGIFANKQDAIDARKAAEAIYQPLKVQPN